LKMERYRVCLSRKAYNDLRGIANYITTEYLAPVTAAKKAKRIKETIQRRLSLMPQKYRLADGGYLASKGYRRMNVEKYAAFFIILEKRKLVRVIRIIHGAREWKRALAEDS